jgi:hypothetical protein
MKKLAIALISLTMVAMLANAQDEQAGGRPLRIGGAGGFMPMWMMPNLDDVNAKLSSVNLPTFSTGGFFGSGGGGYAYIIYIPDVRIGGFGAGGSITAEGVIHNQPTKVEYAASFAGVTIEYAIPIFQRASIVVGSMLGSGSMTLTVLQSDGKTRGWDDVWSDVGIASPMTNYKQKLSSGFFAYNPYVYFEYGVNSLIGVRIGAGYVGNTSGDWKIDDNSTLASVPSGIKLNGLVIQTGIFFGFFPD